jgi:hypothetical protein
VVVNLIHQFFFYQRNEPPVVFHWFPFIGSTVSYGMDPYKFFFASREKVCGDRLGWDAVNKADTESSTATSLLSSYSARRSQSILEPKEMNSS